MFDTLSKAPDDPILGLTAAFRRDPRPNKLNLSAGVYRDQNGQTPVFRSVKLAEARLLEDEVTKDYLPIEGSSNYGAAVQALVLGPGHEAVTAGRAVTAQTPGGTGALRVAGELIQRAHPSARVWISQPTWPNHPNVFKAAGLAVETYPYFDPATNSLRFSEMLDALAQAAPGDAVLLHGCCHNPTGIDPTPAQWEEIAAALVGRGLTPLVDFAYQGLADGMADDARGLLTLARVAPELLICSSFSKNFGLYNERVGALTVIAEGAAQAEAALSHMRQAIRANYSNPPAHGAKIVETVLGDAELRPVWEAEVSSMRTRINDMRRLFVETLKAYGVQRDFSFVAVQRGMFSFTGLTKEQVIALREQYAIYMVESGRMNVAGLTPANLDAVCRSIAAVL